ncbi:MAG TPA: ABC transporter substrate-binding protein [Polyangia bacterium]|nr:ABC transporter substrate-binding protein [Polyangia bacterium]
MWVQNGSLPGEARAESRGAGLPRHVVAGVVAAAVVVAALGGCRGARAPAPPGVLSISVEKQSAWVRNFNPLAPGAGARFPTRAGVYEPLLIFNSITGAYVPWLATSHAWSEDHLALRFALREARWSDGAPFSAADVVVTFGLLHAHPALDQHDVWSFVEDVRATSARTVELRFRRVYVPGLADVAQQPIVPAHVWRDVVDPVTFANPSPVGTGPFTEVRIFRNQVYELGKNPFYWQAGRPRVSALRFLAYPANEQANLALVEGDVDWAGDFVPSIERTYVRLDPPHNHHWSPLVGSMVFLYANTARAPFDDVRVRKALSMGIDRQKLVDVAMYGTTRPADATGLTDAYAAWREPALAARDWVAFDVAGANRLLDEAGYARGGDGLRRTHDGRPCRFDVEVVSGWSDWVRAGQVIARQLAALGFEVELRTYEFGAWYARLARGAFDLSIAWSIDGPTPYALYRALMSSRAVRPLGEAAAANWHRFGDPAVDALLARFEVTDDVTLERALVAQLESRFVELAPAIPLFPNPAWGVFSTRRFEGFPSAEHPYASLSPHREPERLLVLTALAPKVEPPLDAPRRGTAP